MLPRFLPDGVIGNGLACSVLYLLKSYVLASGKRECFKAPERLAARMEGMMGVRNWNKIGHANNLSRTMPARRQKEGWSQPNACNEVENEARVCEQVIDPSIILARPKYQHSVRTIAKSNVNHSDLKEPHSDRNSNAEMKILMARFSDATVKTLQMSLLYAFMQPAML
jgi:ABC-type molybdate transport system ATPase subunit